MNFQGKPLQSGRVMLDGRDVTGWKSRAIYAAGVGYVPADRQRFGRDPPGAIDALAQPGQHQIP